MTHVTSKPKNIHFPLLFSKQIIFYDIFRSLVIKLSLIKRPFCFEVEIDPRAQADSSILNINKIFFVVLALREISVVNGGGQ